MSEPLGKGHLRDIIRKLDVFAVGKMCRNGDGIPPQDIVSALGIPYTDPHPSDVIGLLCRVVGSLYDEVEARDAALVPAEDVPALREFLETVGSAAGDDDWFYVPAPIPGVPEVKRLLARLKEVEGDDQD